MNKKKLIIFTPDQSYGAATNLLNAINMHSTRFTAEGIYVDLDAYDFLDKNKQEKWTNLFSSEEVIMNLHNSMKDPNTYFFGISGRSPDMLYKLFDLHFALDVVGNNQMKISFDKMKTLADKENLHGDTILVTRRFFTRLCILGHNQGYFNSTSEFLKMAIPTMTPRYFENLLHNYLKFDNFNNRLAFWWTDSSYRQKMKDYDAFAEAFELQIFKMLDLISDGDKVLPLMQTYNFHTHEQKHDNFTVIHTPGKRESVKKGTHIVKEVSERLPEIDFKIYGKDNSLPNEQIVLEKKRAHVCIDKITEDSLLGIPGVCGGIGKSALEAIMAGVPTICSMQETPTSGLGRYDNHPAIDVRNADQLEKELIKLSTDKEYYDEVSKKTKEWAKVLTYKNTVKYLDEVLYNG